MDFEQINVEMILTVLGAGLCLGGWIIFWIGSRLLGIAFGMGFGFFFGTLLSLVMRLETGGEALVLLSCSLLGAFGGFVLVRAVTTILFALIGFLFGALLGRLGVDAYSLMTVETIPALTATTSGVIVGGGAVVALLAVWLQKYIMIVITSYIGATYLVMGVAYLHAHERLCFVALFCISILWQSVLASQLLSGKSRRVLEEEP